MESVLTPPPVLVVVVVVEPQTSPVFREQQILAVAEVEGVETMA
jgi:hypothetical protein